MVIGSQNHSSIFRIRSFRGRDRKTNEDYLDWHFIRSSRPMESSTSIIVHLFDQQVRKVGVIQIMFQNSRLPSEPMRRTQQPRGSFSRWIIHKQITMLAWLRSEKMDISTYQPAMAVAAMIKVLVTKKIGIPTMMEVMLKTSGKIFLVKYYESM